MSKEKVKAIVCVICESLILAGITIVAALPISCKITATGIEIVGGDYTAPVLNNVTVLNERSLVLDFSEKVYVKQAVVSPIIPGISDSDEASKTLSLSKSINAALGGANSIQTKTSYSDDEKSVIFDFSEPTIIGQEYELFGLVEDSIGNSLTFSVPFSGFNSAVSKIIMTELHTGMASQLKVEKEKNIRRLEYVEFLALSDGNLAGLEFCSGYAGETKKYEFPAIEVHKGEIFILHLRNWGEGCISEENNNLEEAFSSYTGSYRDLWTSQTTKCIGDTTDILIVRNSNTGIVQDCVMYRAAEIEEWGAKLKVDYSCYPGVSEIYTSTQVEDGTLSTGLSATKFLYRVNASELLEEVLSGTEIDYPVRADSSSWEITGVATPGTL